MTLSWLPMGPTQQQVRRNVSGHDLGGGFWNVSVDCLPLVSRKLARGSAGVSGFLGLEVGVISQKFYSFDGLVQALVQALGVGRRQ